MILSHALRIMLLSLIVTIDCYSQRTFNYNLDIPLKTIVLPEILNEVSGISDIDDEHVACVQDEIGTIFIYNFNIGEIVTSHQFESSGDFEGVAFIRDNHIFVLRSDGRLTEWQNFRSEKGTRKHHQLTLQTKDNEGLCYDPEFDQLLIAGKNKPENKAEKNLRYIYAYSLSAGKAGENPYFIIDINQVEKMAQNRGIVKKELNKKGKPKPFNFSPSDLAIHPIKSTIYILAAEEHLLIETDRNGTILEVLELDQVMFQKAEGIAFLPDGTMLISNEAGDKKPTLLMFDSN